MQNKIKKALLIVNPCAGRTKSRAGTFEIVDKFSTNDFKFSIHTTTCQGDATNIVKKQLNDNDMVVCCGGDGTLNETINGVMDMPRRVPIGYIPTGSTNDLATTLGIPTDINKATDLIMKGETNDYDIGLFNNRYFSYVASFGAFTKSSYATSQKMKNRFGHMAYIMNGLTEWKNIKNIHMKIEYDGGTIEDDFMFGSISNSTSVAGLFKFKKDDVKLNDGIFEILLVRTIKLLSAPAILRKIQKQEYDGQQIVFLRTKKAKITCTEPVDWTLDGEYGGAHKEVMLHVLERAINIYSPENPLFVKQPEPIVPEVELNADDEKDEKLRTEMVEKVEKALRSRKSHKSEKLRKGENDVQDDEAVEVVEVIDENIQQNSNEKEVAEVTE